jgi:hypothetical protein
LLHIFGVFLDRILEGLDKSLRELLEDVFDAGLERDNIDSDAINLPAIRKLLQLDSFLLEHRKVRLPILDAIEMLLNMRLEVQVAEGYPLDVFSLYVTHLIKELLGLQVHSMHVLCIVLRHFLEYLCGLGATSDTLGSQRGRDELLDLVEVFLLQGLERWAELHSLVAKDQISRDLRKVLVEGLQAHSVLELESLVELVVDVSEPEAAEVSWSSFGFLVDNELDLVHLVGPDLPALEEIDVHELYHLVDNIDVNLPQFSILVD